MKPSEIRYAKELALALKLSTEEQFIVTKLENGRHSLEFCGFSIEEIDEPSPFTLPALFEAFVTIEHPAGPWQPEGAESYSLGSAPNLTEALRLCAQIHFDDEFKRIAENVLYVEHESLLSQAPSS